MLLIFSDREVEVPGVMREDGCDFFGPFDG